MEIKTIATAVAAAAVTLGAQAQTPETQTPVMQAAAKQAQAASMVKSIGSLTSVVTSPECSDIGPM